MKWLQVEINCQSREIEGLTGLLYVLGQDELYIEDNALIQELASEKTGEWDYIDAALLCRPPQEGKIFFTLPLEQEQVFLPALKSALKESTFSGVKLQTRLIDEENWQHTWKDFFHAFEVGPRLAIKPSWESYTPRPGQRVLEIDPGQAFGSGQHATTRLCLEAVEKYLRPGDQAADIGCGSGILGLSAALLSASHVTMIDRDPRALEVCAANAALNGLEEAVTILEGDLSQGLTGPYDIITANIVADAIIALAPQAYALLKPGGYFVASGIIPQRGAEVEQALKQAGYAIAESAAQEDWLLYAARKKQGREAHE